MIKCIHLLWLALWWVILIFMSFAISTGNIEIKFWPYIRNMICIPTMFDPDRFTRCSSFWFFNPLQYLPGQFSSRLLLWLATLGCCFLLLLTCSSLLQKFCPLTFVWLIECAPHLLVKVYGLIKMLLPFFSIILSLV